MRIDRHMYVCLCNRITDSEIRRHAGSGFATPGAVYRAKSCVPRCGKCIPMVRAILQESREATGPDQALVAPAA